MMIRYYVSLDIRNKEMQFVLIYIRLEVVSVYMAINLTKNTQQAVNKLQVENTLQAVKSL